jgi:type IV pilus assembly protein PilA
VLSKIISNSKANTKTSLLSNANGFSLVELMVVVAIIGILAGMGIPSMQKQIAKARQSEIKLHLSGIHTAEKAFYAEFNTYTTDFGAMGFAPEGKNRYNAGFSTADTAARLTAKGYGGALNGIFRVGDATPNVTLLAEGAAFSGWAGATADDNGYVAVGGGTIYKSRMDQWSINENKALNNVSNGID